MVLHLSFISHFLVSPFMFMFLASNWIISLPVFGMIHDHASPNEIMEFLTPIACAREGDWEEIVNELKIKFPKILSHSSLSGTLSKLNKEILGSGDLKLIKLYHRAMRNHDTFSAEKGEPVTFYYRHYREPEFFIPEIRLTLDVKEAKVLVTTELKIRRNSREEALILDGKEHKVNKVAINGKAIPKEEYKVTPHELILLSVPLEETFDVAVESEINPFSNTALEGMYRCGKWLTTQCESEGARRIFFTLDRPDVLSRITTTIIADKEQYLHRLSNGNLIKEEKLEDGRWSITWDDPFPKPSYLFACVLGHFSLLTDQFTTRSGKLVELQIYVEPGKESRADYPLFALKKAMEFDEAFFDREYDLSCLKMVGIPDFNSGAMENKGLMIFNDLRLLVDSHSGTDRSHREVAHVVGHEYFHNWSGNRVTVRNWFEIALKEAFTDLRAMLFSEWLFGPGFIRPKTVASLRENQFPEETSEKGHPIIVESYVDAHSIYDATTYTKGREVFRTLKNYLDLLLPDGFREVQNGYFRDYDGQAVTFRELLKSGNHVLKKIGKDLSQFEGWFHQQGTPILKVSMKYDEKEKLAEISVVQTCPHPKTGAKQLPLPIPFSLELLGEDGTILHAKTSSILEDEATVFQINSSTRPTPVFMHGFSAPVILEYDYTKEDLVCIVKYSDDPFSKWEAAQKYSIMALKEMIERLNEDPGLELKARQGEPVFADLQQLYLLALNHSQLSPLSKAQVLEIPSVRALAQAWNRYDFAAIGRFRNLFIEHLAHLCRDSFEHLLEEYPAPIEYGTDPEQMQIRELRHASLKLLAMIDEDHQRNAFEMYLNAENFDDAVASFNICLENENPFRKIVIDDFYNKWKGDKAVFNFWLTSQAASKCRVEDLRRLESFNGYDPKNPNHVRSILRVFAGNLESYHDPKGEGYRYIVDKILEISKFNPYLAHNYIAVPAFIDFEKLPKSQQALMMKELERLKNDIAPPQTRDLVEKILKSQAG